MGCFPPVSMPISQSRGGFTKHAGYQLLFEIEPSQILTVNTNLLLTQWIGVILVGFIVFAFVTFLKKSDTETRSKKSNSSHSIEKRVVKCPYCTTKLLESEIYKYGENKICCSCYELIISPKCDLCENKTPGSDLKKYKDIMICPECYVLEINKKGTV